MTVAALPRTRLLRLGALLFHLVVLLGVDDLVIAAPPTQAAARLGAV